MAAICFTSRSRSPLLTKVALRKAKKIREKKITRVATEVLGYIDFFNL
jgi:hypothetical protein